MLFDVTKNGLRAYAGSNYRTRLPEFGGILTDGEIVAVLSWIKSQWSQDVQERHDAMSAVKKAEP